MGAKSAIANTFRLGSNDRIIINNKNNINENNTLHRFTHQVGRKDGRICRLQYAYPVHRFG